MNQGEQQRKRAAYNRGLADGRHFMRQMMFDLTCIALNDVYGFGPERIMRYYHRLIELNNEFANIYNGDTKDLEYSKRVLDRRLKQIAGEHFVPWEERYSK